MTKCISDILTEINITFVRRGAMTHVKADDVAIRDCRPPVSIRMLFTIFSQELLPRNCFENIDSKRQVIISCGCPFPLFFYVYGWHRIMKNGVIVFACCHCTVVSSLWKCPWNININTRGIWTWSAAYLLWMSHKKSQREVYYHHMSTTLQQPMNYCILSFNSISSVRVYQREMQGGMMALFNSSSSILTACKEIKIKGMPVIVFLHLNQRIEMLRQKLMQVPFNLLFESLAPFKKCTRE